MMPAFNLQGTRPEFQGKQVPELHSAAGTPEFQSAMGTPEPFKLELQKMSVDDLLDLRDQITKMLFDRVQLERRELESRLARLRDVKLTEIDAISTRRARQGRCRRRKSMAGTYGR
jgi:hypothetical protein